MMLWLILHLTYELSIYCTNTFSCAVCKLNINTIYQIYLPPIIIKTLSSKGACRGHGLSTPAKVQVCTCMKSACLSQAQKYFPQLYLSPLPILNVVNSPFPLIPMEIYGWRFSLFHSFGISYPNISF